jgi:hypothetical protein
MSMDLIAFTQGYPLIAALVIVGAGLLIISIIFNMRVADSVRNDARHREKLLEYYRNTFSQLGVILIGIGVSLFMFFFQQNYQEYRRRESELQSALTRMSVRVARAAPLVGELKQFDAILDRGGPYLAPEDGGRNEAVTAKGPELWQQVRDISLVERDIDIHGFEVLYLTQDVENSFIASELDPSLWLNMVTDESDLRYAIAQLEADYADLRRVAGADVSTGPPPPDREAAVKAEVLDVLYDTDLLRQKARRILGRGSWLLAKKSGFIAAKPSQDLEAATASQTEWLDNARNQLGSTKFGNTSCYDLVAPR